MVDLLEFEVIRKKKRDKKRDKEKDVGQPSLKRLKKSVLYPKVTDAPKNDLEDPKTSSKGPKMDIKYDKGWTPQKNPIPIVGGGDAVTTLKVKGGDEKGPDLEGLTPIKCQLPIVGGGDDTTTLKVKGGDVVKVSKGLTPIKCLFPIVGGGDETTTLKVKGGDVVKGSKGLTPKKCLVSIVGGGEGTTTLKVKGGDVEEEGITPIKCDNSVDSEPEGVTPKKRPVPKVKNVKLTPILAKLAKRRQVRNIRSYFSPQCTDVVERPACNILSDTTTETVVDNVDTAKVENVVSELKEVENVTKNSDGFNFESNSSNKSRLKPENAKFDSFPGSKDRPTEDLTHIHGISVPLSRDKSVSNDGLLPKLPENSVDKKVIQCQKYPELSDNDALGHAKEATDVENLVNHEIEAVKKKTISDMQRHLLEDFSIQRKSTNRRSPLVSKSNTILKTRLRLKSDSRRSENVEKSEIKAIFERIKQKKVAKISPIKRYY